MSILDGDFADRVHEAAAEGHRALVLRIAAHWDTNIAPLLIGIPDDAQIRMRAKYIVDVRRNPNALHHFTEGQGRE
jgi:hypothetical protein